MTPGIILPGLLSFAWAAAEAVKEGIVGVVTGGVEPGADDLPREDPVVREGPEPGTGWASGLYAMASPVASGFFDGLVEGPRTARPPAEVEALRARIRAGETRLGDTGWVVGRLFGLGSGGVARTAARAIDVGRQVRAIHRLDALLEKGEPAAIAGLAEDILRIALSPSQQRRDLRDLISTHGLEPFISGLLKPELRGAIERNDLELTNILYRNLFDRAGYARLAAYLSLLKLEDPQRARRVAGVLDTALWDVSDYWREEGEDLYIADLHHFIATEILSPTR